MRVSWADFEEFLRLRGECSGPRVAFIDGALELMSPSKTHEKLGSWIGRLAEVFANEIGVELSPYGSWLLKSAPKAAGAEPDECYIAGPDHGQTVPDLVIEVVWTSGGLDKLEIYRRLGIAEFWQWRSGTIQVFVLRKGRYVLARGSELLPGLDFHLLLPCLDELSLPRAVRSFREALARGGPVAPVRRRRR